MTCHFALRDASQLPKRSSSLHVLRYVKHGFHSARNSSTLQRVRRDDVWIPTVSLKKQDGVPDATELLTRAGYLRQAYSGIYHMLPLGLKVQEKLEKLIDKHMKSIQASKVSLSSISSQNLWQRSGRLDTGSEFFKFADRKGTKWLLAPTHEEEITQIVADVVHSPSQLPIRLYQVSRKYRDEKRPRGGLLRGREFIMKDLYTFDIAQAEAHTTYDHVRQAYRNFLGELKVPYVEARADSGNMGGSLSHEYHFPSAIGEDDVIHCKSCDYARNEEWVPDCPHLLGRDFGGTHEADQNGVQATISESYVDKSRSRIVKVIAPRKASGDTIVDLNTYAIKAAVGETIDLDTGVEKAEEVFLANSDRRDAGRKSVYYLFDRSVKPWEAKNFINQDRAWRQKYDLDYFVFTSPSTPDKSVSLLKQASGDSCPQCKTGTLQVDKAIEVGHTFHLGTRYSSKLGLAIKPLEKAAEPVPVEMGCHGIGISRLIAAIASSVSDSTGLNWPAAIAPFQVIIVVDGKDQEKKKVAENLYDDTVQSASNNLDILLDDRTGVSNGYKLKDADLIGYPVILIIGKTWQQSRQIEIQCRRLNVNESVEADRVPAFVHELLERL